MLFCNMTNSISTYSEILLVIVLASKSLPPVLPICPEYTEYRNKERNPYGHQPDIINKINSLSNYHKNRRRGQQFSDSVKAVRKHRNENRSAPADRTHCHRMKRTLTEGGDTHRDCA